MNQINDTISQARNLVESFLPKEDVSDERARLIIRRYVAAIEGNFVSWMGAAAITARSVQGRYAASENLWVEMKDDHAGMLRAFARGAGAEPLAEDHQSMAVAIQSVRTMVGEMSGLRNLALMAVLENTSAAFVPLLETLAVQLGAPDLTYTKVHGEADIAHADQFAWALEHEMPHHEGAEKIVEDTIAASAEFMRAIFVP